MSQSEPQPPAPGAPSGAGPSSQPLFSRSPKAIAAIASVLAVALGLTLFAAFATSSWPRLGPTASATATATATSIYTPTISPPPTPPPTPVSASGLPAGMEILAFTLTGPDDGWGTGALNPDAVTGVPQAGMILRYAAGVWTQVGPALPGDYLGGIDMVSPSEGWAFGGDVNGKTVTLRISGGSWSQITIPPLAGTELGALGVLAMRAPDEGWMAVVNPKTAQGGLTTVLYHDSGGAWSLVGGGPDYITDIAPIAPGLAWVIGTNADGTSSVAYAGSGFARTVLTSPGYTTFSRLRVFAPNDIWIEGVTHNGNLDYYDSPQDYHYNGVTWTRMDLRAPNQPQHISVISSTTVWGIAYARQTPPFTTTTPSIGSITTNAGGQWTQTPMPYSDLVSLQVISTSSADVWALATYMVTTQISSNSSSSVGQGVLLRYTGGVWTAWGR